MFEYLSVAICFVYLCETKRHITLHKMLYYLYYYIHTSVSTEQNKLLILNKHFPPYFHWNVRV